MGASCDDQVVIPQGMRLDDLEKIAIYQALETTQGNKTDYRRAAGDQRENSLQQAQQVRAASRSG